MEVPKTISGNPPPPPKDWAKRWKLEDALDRMNPMMSMTAAEWLTHTRTVKDQDDDDVKKRARVAAIKAANAAKRKTWSSGNVSGYGTVSPLSTGTEAGTGFSWSKIPSIVWIILAVGGGIYLVKSAGKRK